MANVGGSGFLNSVRNYPTIMISVAGGISNWTAYNFDGAAHNDAYNSLNLPLPFPDALQEFKVESSALQAQYGVHASANVNVVTKSGTNDIHGDAFEFVRNGIFNARNSFASRRDSLKRNQYGGGDQVRHLASIQREFQNSRVLDDCADCRAARLHLGGVRLYLDGLGHLADLQRDINRRIAVHLKHDIRLHKRAESGQCRFQSLRTGWRS